MPPSKSWDELPESRHTFVPPEEFAEWGVRYVRRGWEIWPARGVLPGGRCACGNRDCKAAGKHSRPGWTSDRAVMASKRGGRTPERHAAMVRGYWTGGRDWAEAGAVDNIALLPHLSGLVVIDCDSADAEARLRATYPLPETLSAVSGRRTDGGGKHLVYELEVGDGMTLPGVIPGLGVEIKFASLVMLEPSVHRSGACYRWADWAVPVAEAPEWLAGLVRAGNAPGGGWEGSGAGADVAGLLEALRAGGGEDRWLRGLFRADLAGVARLAGMRAGEGGRPSRAHALAWHLAVWVVGGLVREDQVERLLMDALERNGAVRDYGATDLIRQIRNGLRDGTAAVLAAAAAGGAA